MTQILDKNNQNKLTAGTIRSFFKSIGEKVTDKEIKSILADAGGDITLDKFTDMYL